MSIGKIQEDIKNQFISIFDSVIFVSEYGEGTNEQAFNLIKAKLLNKQIYLLLVDDFYLEQIRLFRDDYEVEGCEDKYITVDFIEKEIKKSIANQKVTSDIKNYGFGLKRFYETLQGDGIQITIPSDFIFNAQSPDCYNDYNNPLTNIVHELQKENKLLKEEKNSSYITKNAYLQTQLDQADTKLKEYEQKLLKTKKTDIQGDNKDLKGLDKNNYDKAKAKSMATIVANFLWSMDTNQKIKIGDMVQQLKPLLSEFDFKAMPETDNTIKDWIRDNAPDYAKKGGRPSNNDEKEIILTMKK